MNAGVNISNLFDKTYYTSAVYNAPISGFQMGGRYYGAPFAVLGHLSAEWPGVPGSPASSPPPTLPSTFTWTGPYVGGQIGYTWGDNAGAFSYGTPDGLFGSQALVGDAQGIIFGAHVGYDQQIDNWVVGLEGSLDYTNLVKDERLGFSPADVAALFAGGTVMANVQSDIQGRFAAAPAIPSVVCCLSSPAASLWPTSNSNPTSAAWIPTRGSHTSPPRTIARRRASAGPLAAAPITRLTTIGRCEANTAIRITAKSRRRLRPFLPPEFTTPAPPPDPKPSPGRLQLQVRRRAARRHELHRRRAREQRSIAACAPAGGNARLAGVRCGNVDVDRGRFR